jgi:salicylate hydroxylase
MLKHTKSPDQPSMTLADGSVVTADLIVAADGVHSIAAEAITGKANLPQPAIHNNCCYRFLIPTAVLEANTATRFFTREEPNDGARVYSDIEGQRRLVTYPCRKYGLQILGFRVHQRLQLKRR